MRKYLLLVFIVTLCLTLGGAYPVAAQSDFSIIMDPDSVIVPINGDVDLYFKITGAQSIYGFDVRLKYDPSSVEVVSQRNGGFLKQGFEIANQIDATAGTTLYALTQLSPEPAKSGDGLLLIVRIKGLQPGKSRVEITFAQLVDLESRSYYPPVGGGSLQVSTLTSTATRTATPLPTPTATLTATRTRTAVPSLTPTINPSQTSPPLASRTATRSLVAPMGTTQTVIQPAQTKDASQPSMPPLATMPAELTQDGGNQYTGMATPSALANPAGQEVSDVTNSINADATPTPVPAYGLTTSDRIFVDALWWGLFLVLLAIILFLAIRLFKSGRH